MIKRSQFVRFGAAAALFALVPALSLADPQNGVRSTSGATAGSATPPGGSAQSGRGAGDGAAATTATSVTTATTTTTPRSSSTAAARARTLNVDNHFTHALANGCQYVSTLQGTLRELNPAELAQMGVRITGPTPMRPAGEGERGGMLYRPNLRYTARVTCPNGTSQQGVSYTLAGVPLTWGRLQRVLEDGGRIVSYEGGPVCSYSPRFTFENGRVAAAAVNESCEQPTARGGGPAPDLSPPPGMLPSNPVLPSAGGASGEGADRSGPSGGGFEHNPGGAVGPEQSGGLPAHGGTGGVFVR